MYLHVDDVFVKPEFRSLSADEKMMRFIRRKAVTADINMVRWEVGKAGSIKDSALT